MQEIVVLSWCDRCAMTAPSAKIESAHSVTLAIGPSPVREVDLCDPCWQQLKTSWLPLLDRGRPVDGKDGAPTTASSDSAKSPAPKQLRRGAGIAVACPVCDLETTADRLAEHWRSRHRQMPGAPETISDLFGTVCPVCGEDPGRGLGVHVSRAHDLAGVAHALVYADVHGDPHGVSAAVRVRAAALRRERPAA